MNFDDSTIQLSESFERVVRQLVAQSHFDAAKEKYKTWCDSLLAKTSIINHRLYFLELLEQVTGNTRLKENEKLILVLLKDSGVREVGDCFERVGQNGKKKRWTVIWRRVGPRYGVEMGLKSEDGELLSGEFFD